MRACAILLAAALLASAGRASAQGGEPPEAARAAFERGRDAYGRELFTQAEDAFREAYSLVSPTDPRRAILLLNPSSR